MKGITLTMQVQTKYEIFKHFVDNKSTNFKNLALKLNCFQITSYNVVNKYQNFGKESFRHKNQIINIFIL